VVADITALPLFPTGKSFWADCSIGPPATTQQRRHARTEAAPPPRPTHQPRRCSCQRPHRAGRERAALLLRMELPRVVDRADQMIHGVRERFIPVTSPARPISSRPCGDNSDPFRPHRRRPAARREAARNCTRPSCIAPTDEEPLGCNCDGFAQPATAPLRGLASVVACVNLGEQFRFLIGIRLREQGPVGIDRGREGHGDPPSQARRDQARRGTRA